MAHVRESLRNDISILAPHLRAADMKELEAHATDASTALTLGFMASKPCYTIEHEDKPIGMFGVSPHPEDQSIGHVWLLGSDDITNIRTRFLRESKHWLADISQEYRLLCNVVHEENELHIRWLEFLGFTFLRHQSPFIEFGRITACVTQPS